jgi:hypothetical protein
LLIISAQYGALKTASNVSAVEAARFQQGELVGWLYRKSHNTSTFLLTCTCSPAERARQRVRERRVRASMAPGVVIGKDEIDDESTCVCGFRTPPHVSLMSRRFRTSRPESGCDVGLIRTNHF